MLEDEVAVVRLEAEEVHRDEEDLEQAEVDEVHREAEADLQEQEEASQVVGLPSREVHREADRGEVVEGVAAIEGSSPPFCIHTLYLSSFLLFPVAVLAFQSVACCIYVLLKEARSSPRFRIADHDRYTLPLQAKNAIPLILQ